MGLRLACPRRELPAAREEADSAESKAPALDSNLKAEPGDGLREELRRLETLARYQMEGPKGDVLTHAHSLGVISTTMLLPFAE